MNNAKIFLCKMSDYLQTPLCQKSKVQSDYSQKVLHYICKNHLGKSAQQLNLQKTVQGKWVADGAFFSISHSGCLLAVAIANTAIGVDLQKLAKVDMPAIVGRFFCLAEQQAWKQSADKQKEFFFTWCKKEALWKSLDAQPLTVAQVDTSGKHFLQRQLQFENQCYFLVCTQEAVIEMLPPVF